MCDLAGHLRDIVTSRVHIALKKNKELASQDYLGCDIKQFRIHLESQFGPGMSWENHGTWHIDHIIPIHYPGAAGAGPTIEEITARLHYTNTQPLWAKDNMVKGNRWIGGAHRPDDGHNVLEEPNDACAFGECDDSDADSDADPDPDKLGITPLQPKFLTVTDAELDEALAALGFIL